MLPAIAFPMIDPIAISVGPLAVRWYALAYIAGIILGWVYAVRLTRNERLWAGPAPVSPQRLDDFVVWATLGIILGGRIGYVLVYNLPFFLANPAEIVKVWHGGMSFHGGLLGVVLAIVLFARRHTLPPLSLADVVTAAAPIGLFFGRIANFINAELWGRTTDVPWGVVFPGAGPDPRHPSQLYEAALEGLVLFILLAILVWGARMLRRPRFIAGAFVAGYGLARIVVEFFREPDAQLGFLLGTGWLTMGMVLSTPMVLAGLWAMATARKPGAPA